MHGVKVRTSMLHKPIPFLNVLLLFAKCTRRVYVRIIIIGINSIANWKWKEGVRSLKLIRKKLNQKFVNVMLQ